jgi:hypothetical protein
MQKADNVHIPLSHPVHNNKRGAGDNKLLRVRQSTRSAQVGLVLQKFHRFSGPVCHSPCRSGVILGNVLTCRFQVIKRGRGPFKPSHSFPRY